MQINKLHGNYNIVKRTQAVKYIVVHYVGAGSSSSGNAKNNCIYFGRANRDASAHYFVDDGGIWEYADPKAYYTWHCGDGHGKYGITNANSIGIEVCQNGDRPFTEVEIRHLTELVRYLMNRFGVPASRVVRHYDASHKMCPLYYAKRSSEWDKLHKAITGQSTTKPATQTKPASTTTTSTKELVKKGQRGLNSMLGAKLVIDGSRGAQTKKCEVMAVQYGANKQFRTVLAVDGSFGRASRSAMANKYIAKGSHGMYVRAIQCILYTHGYDPNGIDSNFGAGMDKCVRNYQKDHGLSVDGSVGYKTLLSLIG